MNRDSWIVFCFAYILGLLTTGIYYFSSANVFWLTVVQIAATLVFLLSVICWYLKQNDFKTWLFTVAIAVAAIAYFNLRIPQPQPHDISQIITVEQGQLATVTGTVLTEPRLNSSYKLKFWLKAKKVALAKQLTTQAVTGKLYVTLPLIEGKNINPRQKIAVQGLLYKPRKANNSVQFDFKKYLAEHNTFAGIAGFKVINSYNNPLWGWYRLRQRIIRAQVKGLGSPWGQLISSMVLGKKAVDLPEDIRNLFVKGGLAHVLAASGFHVSLLLGITLKLTQSLAAKKQLIIGGTTLLIYSLLTGFSASVVRAVIMGFAVLIAKTVNAKVRPFGSLLLAAIAILLINPLWIWNLSFQLSFLATLGLVISLPTIEAKLDWLPSNLASLTAVPLAASLWTLPLIGYVFNAVATYSIIVNIITTPLVAIISLGGMISSAIALIIPALGSAIAWLLKYPILLLVSIIKFFVNLPGSTIAIGTIPLWLLLVLYALILLFSVNKKLQQNCWIAVAVLIIFPTIFLRHQYFNLLQVTVFNNSNSRAIVLQDRGQAIVIYEGKAQAIKYNLAPFLNSQGINQIDYFVTFSQSKLNYAQNLAALQSLVSINKLAIYPDNNACLAKCQQELLSIAQKKQFNLLFNPTIVTKAIALNLTEPANILQLTINDTQWLITDDISALKKSENNQHQVLLWLGKKIDYQTLKDLNFQIAIANTVESVPNTVEPSLQLYTTKNNNLITWTPQEGFETATEKAQRNNTFW